MAGILGLMFGTADEGAGEEEEEESKKLVKQIADSDLTYEVVLEKSEGPWGIGYRAVRSKSGLVITTMSPDTPVTGWNDMCDVNETVCVGDRIQSVNGVVKSSGMVEELRSKRKVTMTLVKSGPRWHILGITAACMDQIEKAMARGVTFEAKAVEDDSPVVHEAAKVNCQQFLIVLLACGLPSLVVLMLFSDMSYGLWVYGLFSPWESNEFGNGICLVSTMYGIGLYVADWSAWPKLWQKQVSGVICLYGYAIGFIVKCRYYPYAPLIVSLFHIPVFLAVVRATALRYCQRTSFYYASSISNLLLGLLVLLLWLLWISVDTWDGSHFWGDETKTQLAKDSEVMYDNNVLPIGGRERSLDYAWDCQELDYQPYDFRWENNQRVATGYALTTDELNDRDKKCGQVKTIWFLMWLSPFICVMTHLIIAAFCLINSFVGSQDISRVEKLLKGTVLAAGFLLMSMWVSVSIAGASMRLTGTLLAFCGSAMIALCIWVYLEIGSRALTATIRTSPVMQSLVALSASNWVRAGLVTSFGVLIPAGLLLSMLNQRVRKLRGVTQSNGRYTEGAERAMKALAYWNWGDILMKVNWWVTLYWVLSVGVAKATFIFLSWLNELLLTVDFGVVFVVFFAVGLALFLLPPVPGIPVYIASGIVLAARASALDIGFWGGTVIAVLQSFTLKLVAVCGQYMIGYFMGKSVQVQKACRVDKKFMKGVAKILSTKGFSLPKVSVLIGAPDWPTSVICGILRINLFQCLLGTTPVIVVLTPCVLAGAFLAGPNVGSDEEDNEGIWSTLASSALAMSAAVQLASGVSALYFVQDTIHRYDDELRAPRPEHAAVLALRQADKERDDACLSVLEWKALPKLQKVIIMVSVTSMLLSFFVFLFMDETNFRPFQVNNRIGDPYGKGGLAGDAWSIVLWPGWAAQGVFTFGFILHLVFMFSAQRRARKYLAQQQQQYQPKLAEETQGQSV